MTMRLAAVLIALFAVSCQTPGRISQRTGPTLTAGMNMFEVRWIAGEPNSVREGVGELFLVYDDGVLVMRNGYLSHVIGGATPRFNLLADAIKVSPEKGKRVFIRAKSDDKASDIYFSEYTKYLTRALTLRGYKATDDENAPADITIAFDFSIQEQKEQIVESVSVPTTSYVWSPETTTTGNHSGSLMNGYGILSGQYSGSSSYRTSGGMTTVLSETQKIVSSTKISYGRTFELEAYGAKISKTRAKPIWKLTIQSDGASRDKRLNFAVMAASATKFLGSDSKGEFTYLTAMNDPVVAYVRGEDAAIRHYDKAPSKDLLTGAVINFRDKTTLSTFNSSGETPLALAFSLGRKDLLEQMLMAGANPNLTRIMKPSIMAQAIDLGDSELVALLLKYGANPNADMPGSKLDAPVTAVDYAKKKSPEIYEMLKQAKATIEANAKAKGARAPAGSP